MTITEAMRLSKDLGGVGFARTNQGLYPINYGGWMKYQEGWFYTDMNANDLMADDWELELGEEDMKNPKVQAYLKQKEV